MKKKLVTVLLIVVIVFNFIFSGSVYADPDDPSVDIKRYGGNDSLSGDSARSVIETGTSADGSTFSHKGYGGAMGLVMQYLAIMFNSFPMAIQTLMTIMAMNPTGPNMNNLDAIIEWGSNLFDMDTYFTIERTVFNEVALFNIDVFNQEDQYTNGIGSNTEEIYQPKANLVLKQSAAKWYYICRLLAMIINLLILIYVGIRMAVSTVASEEAKYKKMLIDWAQSMILLFVLHYVMMFFLGLGSYVQNIIYSIRADMEAAGQVGFEDIVLYKIYRAISETSGMEVFLYSVFFWFLTFVQIKFFFTYIKRTLTVMFLTIIAPFITVTYPIDKMGDGKAQAFAAWFKEYIINIAIQPIHASIYLVFIFTAGKIAETAPLVAMLFLLCLGWLENIVRNIFQIAGSVSMQNVDKGFGKKG